MVLSFDPGGTERLYGALLDEWSFRQRPQPSALRFIRVREDRVVRRASSPHETAVVNRQTTMTPIVEVALGRPPAVRVVIPNCSACLGLLLGGGLEQGGKSTRT